MSVVIGARRDVASRAVELGRVAWAVVGLIVVGLAGAWLMGRLMPIVIAVVVAALLSTLLGPPVGWLRARRVPGLLAVWLVVLGLLALLAGTVAWVVPNVSGEMGAFQHSVSGGVTRIEDWLVTGPLHLPRARVDGWATSLRRQSGSLGSEVAKGVLARTPLALEAVGAGVMTLVLLFYFLRLGSTGRVRTWVLARSYGPQALGAWHSLAGFARGLVVNAAVNAAAMGLALVVLRVPLAGPIAAVTFLASFVPLAGAIVAGTLAALVALVAMGPGAALLVVVVTVAVHHLEAYIVGPRVIGDRVGLHPLVLILGIAVGLSLAGIAGAFLVGPLVALALGWLRAEGREPAGDVSDRSRSGAAVPL